MKQNLEQHNIPPGFVFNVDKSGFQKWADKKRKAIIAPSEIPDEEILIPVDRQSRRYTLEACISLYGSYLKPLIITSRKTINKDL